MKEIVASNKCTGCATCMNVCPKKAISMIVNSEGFLHPIIDQEKCINCGICKKKCPVINLDENESLKKCFAAYNKNDEELINSSSGGIYVLLAKTIISNGGVVYASKMNGKKLTHIRITSHEEILSTQGSKYMQSDLGYIYSSISEDVKTKKVLFVGTPCQTAGISSYFGKDVNNLYLVDLVCHGVPSEKLFNKYISNLENKNKDKFENIEFRNKKYGWSNFGVKVKLQSKEVFNIHHIDKFMSLFLSDIALRDCCYNCKFKLDNRYSDLTIGDYWGIHQYHNDFVGDKGVSCIIVNSDKGDNLFNKIKDDLFFTSTELDYLIESNPVLIETVKLNFKRKQFFEDLDKMKISKLSNKYGRKYTFKVKLKKYVKQLIIKK